MQAYPRLREAASALRISDADMRGPVLVKMGQLHRKQMLQNFAAQAGAAGRWAPLNPSYAKRKRKAVGSRKILVLTGDMKARFTKALHPAYHQDYLPVGAQRGVFRFGARSDVAAAHFHGTPSLAPTGSSVTARKIFGGIAPRLPVRDMITKTEAQRRAFIPVFVTWYTARVRQVLRALNRLAAR